MSRRVSALARRARKNAPRCKMCKSKDVKVTNYDDGTKLLVCQSCLFPERRVP